MSWVRDASFKLQWVGNNLDKDSSEAQDLIEDYRTGEYSERQLAAKYHIPKSRVRLILVRNNVNLDTGRKFKYDRQEICRMIEEGLSLSEISKQTGACVKTVSEIRIAFKGVNDKKIVYDVERIEQLLIQGVKPIEIARQIGCSPATITRRKRIMSARMA